MDKYGSDDVLDRLKNLTKWVEDVQGALQSAAEHIDTAVSKIDELRMRTDEDLEYDFQNVMEILTNVSGELESI